MRSHATTCTPDKAGYAARLPFCLPQNGSGFIVPLQFEIEPTTDTSVCPSGNEGLNLSEKEDASKERFMGKVLLPLPFHQPIFRSRLRGVANF
jgi:hypothetical protein